MNKYNVLFYILILCSCSLEHNSIDVGQWDTIDLGFFSTTSYDNPYTDVSFSATFINEQGVKLTRPGFWNGKNEWRVRFTPPDANSIWKWTSTCSNVDDTGLHNKTGSFRSVMNTSTNRLEQNGLLEMSPAKRNAVFKNGKAFMMIGDTPWALPFRATKDQAKIYARDRQVKGFNAALLMTLQPDMEANGPEGRNIELGFARAFRDLSDGHINLMNPSYFQYLDTLINILLDHEIVPVYQPVFHGFGWKGKNVLGNHIVPDEYVRYCRYLLARYGSKPAMWLLAGDNGGRDPGVKEAGEMLEQEDCYHQPTGLHYNPCDDYIADWAIDNPLKHCEHYNKTYQEEEWLDFQWAQTGHSDEHLYHKVKRMYDNLPTKASANGEPTYEGMNDGKNGLGWWQGEEAWMQWMSGGTMGVVYGAAGLWQWKVTADESGWTSWATQLKSWEEAMAMEGATYVGIMGQMLDGLDVADIRKDWSRANDLPMLYKPNELYIAYLNNEGPLTIQDNLSGMKARWVDPKSGNLIKEMSLESNDIPSAETYPAVFIAQKAD